jgi:DNA-binding IclR family transcriptional regulator
VAERIRSLAAAQRTSANRVLVSLVESGLAARDAEKRHFMELAEKLARSSDSAEQEILKEELARLTFGT